MYASKSPSNVKREQPLSVSPDPNKSALAIVQPPSTHTHQRGEQHVVVGANVPCMMRIPKRRATKTTASAVMATPVISASPCRLPPWFTPGGIGGRPSAVVFAAILCVGRQRAGAGWRICINVSVCMCMRGLPQSKNRKYRRRGELKKF